MLGWSPRWQGYLAVAEMEAKTPLRAARISAIHRGGGECIVADSGETTTFNLSYPHPARALEQWPPVVGDWAGLDAEGAIATVLPRVTYLERAGVSRSSLMQPIAANIDALVIVEPLRPSPSIGRIERFVALAHAAGISPWLVLTKADLVDAADAREVLERVDYLVDRAFAVSNAEESSLTPLREAITPHDTLVLVGRSGAGKTTLTNALLGLSLATAAVREGDGKGRHTTTRRQLVATPHGIILDTPGIRALAATPDADAIDETFAAITDLARGCRFADCTHDAEPGCAIREAVDLGDLDAAELDRYRRMRAEAQRQIVRADARLHRAEQRQASKNNTRGRRDAMARKGRRR
ncbi:ribosome small subunit-dependent GTPase A [Nanchangia anserum]|uniref:Small ribosomal subunit biogenesis GTPase RsgA n=1 Tax=Nanchangia anserum TaxID=2692125 RepID=A0A8I0KPL8_9ACTO|nr:ribosome small subunit-dependent GTPase A [Nanchangia anserum]MBD3689030.1 ribosome small subunit-dependent GTPase A [Nanchangia anserum]QOX81273.1 ribosome small subunit-dependent GTPase A [Nanchangia anserum]